MSTSGAPSKPSGPRSQSPGSLEPGRAPRAPERSLVRPSLPAPYDRNSLRAAFEVGETIDVRVSGVPIPGRDHASDSRNYLRAYTFGVTDESPGRYSSEPSSELGRGAIGRVYVAQDSHLGRQVAIKELLQGAHESRDDSLALQTVSRFLREARVTGALEHPGIVPVYELGRRADGTLYYTMSVVHGRTLAQAMLECRSLDERLELVNHFCGLCQAIAYAHSRGVVHRDIKPENVMIGEFGETVVLDWGMAKLCRSDGPELASPSLQPAPPQIELTDLGLTLEGSVCGTPLYMSPEQASGRTGDVDQRSDVWSLGVVLYTILCGRPPFGGSSLLEIIAQVNAGRHTPLRVIDPQIPAELAAVVERALQLNKQDRYSSARELARDIQAYQAGTRVAAYEYSSLELLQRFVARHRAAVTASALALVVTVVLCLAAYRRVLVARDRAIFAEKHALENELFAKQSARAAGHSLGEVLLERAEQALLEGDSVDAELLAARALRQEERADARGIVIAAQSTLRPNLLATMPETAACTHSAVSFTANLFACSVGRELRLWDLTSKARTLSLPLPSEPTTLAFAADASTLAVALSDGSVGFSATTALGDGWHFESCGAKPTAVAVAVGGRYLACGNARGEVSLWQAAPARPKLQLSLGQAVSALSFAKDGSRLVFGGELGALVVYDIATRSERKLSGHTGTVLALSLAEQGRYLASGGADRMLRFWDTESGAATQAPILHSDAIATLAWSDDRHFMALGGRDKTFRVIDLRTGHSALSRQHDEPVELVAVSPDASGVASYSRDTGLRLWSLPAAKVPTELTERGNVLVLSPALNNEQLLSAGLGRNGACIWDLPSGGCTARLPVRLDRVRALAVSPDRQKLALAGSGTQIFIWDLAQKIPTQVLEGLHDETRALSFSLDGRTLAAAGLDRKLRLFDSSSASLLHETDTGTPIQTLSVAPQSGELIAGDQAGTLSVWSWKTGQREASFQAHSDWVLGSAASPDGTQLASSGADRMVYVWDLRTRKRRFSLSGHAGKVLSVDFSPDGALLASAGEDKSVRLWNAHTGLALATLTGHAGVVRAVRFTGAPSLLATGSDDGAIRLWHLGDLRRSGAELEANIRRQFGLNAQRSELDAKAEAAGL